MTYNERMRGRFTCCGAPVSSLEIRAIYDGTCCWTCYTCGALYRRWRADHAVTRRLVAWLATRVTCPINLRENPDTP